MKTKITTFIAAIVLLLFDVSTVVAQGTKAYFKKDGVTVFESAIADIDSIVFLPKSTVFAVDISKETDWSYMLVGNDGSSAFVSLNENSNMPTHLFFRPDKNSDAGFTLFFRENGLPETIVLEDYIIYMSNFGETKFDMAVIYPNDSIEYYYGMNSPVNWSNYINKPENSIRSVSSDAAPHLGIVGDGLGIVACLVNLVKKDIVGILGCGTTLGGVMSDDFASKILWTYAGAVLTVLGCALTGGLGCVLGIASTAFSYYSLQLEEKKQLQERELYYIEFLNEMEEIRQSYQIKLTSDIVEMPYPAISSGIDVITKSEWQIEKEDMGWCIAQKSNLYDRIDIKIIKPYPESTGQLDGYQEVTFRVCPKYQTVPCASFTVKQIGFEYTIEPKELHFTATGTATDGKDVFDISIPEKYSANVERVEVIYNKDDDDKWCSSSLFGGGRSYIGVKVSVKSNEKKERNALIKVIFKLGEYSGHTFVSVSQEGRDKDDEESQIRAMLEKLYQDTDGDNWTNKTNWLSDMPINEWYGITYSTGNLSIYLTDNNLRGSIDVSGCTILKDRLWCNQNQLTSVNVSGCTRLEALDCSNNPLTNLNVSGCMGLAILYCYSSHLTSINVSGYSNLTELFCYSSHLTNVNVSACSNLALMDCSGNFLTDLNVSGYTLLRMMYCNSNSLLNLNVNGCTNLTYLHCGANQLTSLNVGSCLNLGGLDCSFNPLANLNVNGCTALTDLNCYSTAILSEIPAWFSQLASFIYDIRYNYYYDYESYSTKFTDNGVGWWYPGEPAKGYHGQ